MSVHSSLRRLHSPRRLDSGPVERPLRGFKASHKGLKVSLRTRLRLGTCCAGIALPQVRAGSGEQSDAFDVMRHREDTDRPERERDPLRAAALRRRTRSLTCGDAALGDCGRRTGVAGLCESK